MAVAFFLLIISVTILEANGKDAHFVNKTPSYHLAMLKRSVDQMKRSWATSGKSHLVKRSTEAKADDLFLKSVASYCTQFQSDPDITKYLHKDDELKPLSARDITGHGRYKSKTSGPHQKVPDVFPVSVQAQREGDQVWIVFEIAHSQTAIISRIDPFHFQKTVLEKPDDSCSLIVSKARFVVEAPNATLRLYSGDDDDKKHGDVGFMVSNAEENSPNMFTIFPDVWKFDKKWSYSRGRYHLSGLLITDDVTVPSLQLAPDPGDVVFVKEGQDVKIELNSIMFYSYPFYIRVVLWDWYTESLLQLSAIISVRRHQRELPKIEYDVLPGDGEQIFFLTRNRTTSYVTIVIKTSSGLRSGMLHLAMKKDFSRYTAPIQRAIAIERTIQLKNRYQSQNFPSDLIYFNPKWRFICNENGYKDWMIHSDSCQVRCQAFGSDITSLYITKLEPMRRKMKSASYKLPGNTVAVLDVGPASGEIEGEYKCTAVDGQGRIKTHVLKLFTSFLTRIQYFELLSEYDDDTAFINCTVYGTKDVNISISVIDEDNIETRLDILDKYDKEITDNENGQTTLTLTVPWTDLEIPQKFLKCLASGDRGDDQMALKLHNYPQNYIDVYPKFKSNGSGVERFDNDTFAVKCSVTGKQPIDFKWYFADRKTYVFMDEPEYKNLTTTTEVKGNTSISTIYVPYEIARTTRSKCVAGNKYRESYRYFSFPID